MRRSVVCCYLCSNPYRFWLFIEHNDWRRKDGVNRLSRNTFVRFVRWTSESGTSEGKEQFNEGETDLATLLTSARVIAIIVFDWTSTVCQVCVMFRVLRWRALFALSTDYWILHFIIVHSDAGFRNGETTGYLKLETRRQVIDYNTNTNAKRDRVTTEVRKKCRQMLRKRMGTGKVCSSRIAKPRSKCYYQSIK